MKMQSAQNVPVQPLLNDLQLMSMMAARLSEMGGSMADAVDNAEEIVLLIVTRDMEHRGLHNEFVSGCYSCEFRRKRAEVDAKMKAIAESAPKIVTP